MAARDVRKNINLFVDGRGYAGQLQEFNPPVLTQKTEEFRGGGMVGPVAIPMGLEALMASATLIAYDRARPADIGRTHPTSEQLS